jgi:hypothetical protein
VQKNSEYGVVYVKSHFYLLNTKWLWVQFIMKQCLKWGSILLILTNNMAKIQSMLGDGWLEL